MIKMQIIIPAANVWEGGYMGITLSVYLSSCLSVQTCPVHTFLQRNIRIYYSTQSLPMTQGCVMTLIQDQLGKFKVTGRKIS